MRDVDLTFETLWSMAWNAHAIVAHNADFDRKFMKAFVKDIKVGGREFPNLPWLCTCWGPLRWNMPWNKLANRKLQTLAGAYNVGLNDAHRALFDCGILGQVFQKTDTFEDQVRLLLKRPKLNGGGNEGSLDQSSDDVARS
jgi:DNA polymerase III epsilon subunit-like protein